MATGLLAVGGVAAEPGATRLRFGWRPGLELRYRLTLEGRTTTSLGERAETSRILTRLHLTQRVLATAPDGSARLLTRVASGRSTKDGGKAEVMPPREGTMRMGPRGTLLDGTALTENTSPLQLIFPEDPVEVGSSWLNALPPSEEIPVPIRVRYTLLGSTTSGERPCVRIGVDIDSAQASALPSVMQLGFRATGEILFDYAAGVLVSSQVHTDLNLDWERVTPEGLVPVRHRVALDMHLELRE